MSQTSKGMGLILAAILSFSLLAQTHEIFNSQHLYDYGYYGLYPQISYKSFELKAPRLNFRHWEERCDDDGYYLIAPKGVLVLDPGPLIVDSRASNKFNVVTGFQVQTYRSELCLTFWSSPGESLHGYGRGRYYMLDSSYEVFRIIEPVGPNLKASLHEFKITQDGTALVTIYNAVPADLSVVGGPAKGWALDCMFQEIDIETRELIFEWSAMQHVPLNDTVRYFAGEGDGSDPEHAFDFMHITSLDKDAHGNYVVSGRHTHSVMCVSPSGDTLWTLGGKKNDFRDLSGGKATYFAYQHHVRLLGNDVLSIFYDSRTEYSGSESPNNHSRGLVVQLDTTEMTATLVQEYYDPARPKHSNGDGSVQIIDDRAVVGYGTCPAWTEFTSNGKTLCDVQLAPAIASRWGLVTSYQVFKTKSWVGRPIKAPEVFLKPSEDWLYVSWNGATKVGEWVLQGAEWDELHKAGNWHDIKSQPRLDFETSFEIKTEMPKYLRVAAVDKSGSVIMHTKVVDRRFEEEPDHAARNVILGVTSGIIAVAILLFIVWRRKRLGGLGGRVANGTTSSFSQECLPRWRSWRSRFRSPDTEGCEFRTPELEPLYEE